MDRAFRACWNPTVQIVSEIYDMIRFALALHSMR